MRIARDWHVASPGKPQLVAGAIEGLLSRLDPEAELYTRSDLRRISRFAPSGGAGVGIELRREPAQRRSERRGYRVISTRDASPAALAGIKAGDLITHVDGLPAGDIQHLAMMHVSLAGAPGTGVRVVLERADDEASPEEVVLERTDAPGPTLAVDEIAPGIARIRLAALDENVTASLERALSGLSALKADAGSRGVVLDLRSTAADGPESAATIADAFLESGPVLRTVSRARGSSRNADATPGDIAEGRPLVVLVDAGTAGAAEMLAAALHEGRRARLVGVKTAGRGAVRTLVALDARGGKGDQLRLTTGRLLTPAGAAIEGKGLMPDVVVEQTPATTRCRSLDIEDPAQAGRCVPRSVVQDGQLARAIALLGEPVVAAERMPAQAKP